MSRVMRHDLVELAARLRATLVPLARQLRSTDGRFTPTQLSVLGSISRHQPINLGDLAGRERLSAPMISRVVVALEEEGMVERLDDREDRRVCLVQLTTAAQRWIEQGRVHRNAWLAARLADLDPEDRAVLDAAAPVLERLIGPED